MAAATITIGIRWWLMPLARFLGLLHRAGMLSEAKGFALIERITPKALYIIK
jgi:hypothetical protein